jgi:hypothetical protein
MPQTTRFQSFGAGKRVMRALTALVACTALSACVAFPHHEGEAPAITGVLLDARKPVDHADVRLTSAQSNDVSTAVTTANGRFKVGPLRSLRFYYIPPGDRLTGYRIQVRSGGKNYDYDGLPEFDGAENRFLTCDLSPSAADASKEPFGHHNSSGNKPESSALVCW